MTKTVFESTNDNYGFNRSLEVYDSSRAGGVVHLVTNLNDKSIGIALDEDQSAEMILAAMEIMHRKAPQTVRDGSAEALEAQALGLMREARKARDRKKVENADYEKAVASYWNAWTSTQDTEKIFKPYSELSEGKKDQLRKEYDAIAVALGAKRVDDWYEINFTDIEDGDTLRITNPNGEPFIVQTRYQSWMGHWILESNSLLDNLYDNVEGRKIERKDKK